jgi:hypothetical protein
VQDVIFSWMIIYLVQRAGEFAVIFTSGWPRIIY